MAKRKIGSYENPTEEDIERIARDAEFAWQHQQNLKEGFICIGAFDKDSTDEEHDEALLKAFEEYRKRKQGRE